jgi:hypothetical protein
MPAVETETTVFSTLTVEIVALKFLVNVSAIASIFVDNDDDDMLAVATIAQVTIGVVVPVSVDDAAPTKLSEVVIVSASQA